MKYEKFEELLGEAAKFQSEYRLFARLVGMGPGIRARLKEMNYKDFRYDYLVGDDLLVEIQGSGYSHSGKGQIRDMRKNNDALKQGYRVAVFPASLVKSRPDIVVEDILEMI